jgi:hypothetical protein
MEKAAALNRQALQVSFMKFLLSTGDGFQV